ncbi:MAG: YceD family protein [Fimbriimonadaceae bacterium]|nr:YceD family protein [Fimbriimonadaceae bacterium]
MRRSDLLDLNEALQFPGKRLVFEVETRLESEEDLDLLTPVTGTLEAVSTGSVLVIGASLSARVVLECARCIAPLEVDLDFEMEDDFQVEGVPSSWARDGQAKVVFDEPEPLFHNNHLFRDRYIRQGLLLQLPLQPLCSGGWDGPCPRAADSPAAGMEPLPGKIDLRGLLPGAGGDS